MTALGAETAKSAQSAETTQNTRSKQSTKSTQNTQFSEYLSLSYIVKILNEDYHFPITKKTLAKYVHEGIITPDYVLKRRFLFHKDRVPEIVDILKNKFREKRLNQNNQNAIKKEDKNSEIDFKKMLLEVFEK
jgi:hypothetical protein